MFIVLVSRKRLVATHIEMKRVISAALTIVMWYNNIQVFYIGCFRNS